jgi:nitrogen fixation NifU-like protein
MNVFVYQEKLMDHYKYPRNNKLLKMPDFVGEDNNPSCGDRLRIEGKIEGNRIVALGFKGEGCILSQAAASMLTEKCKQKTTDQVLALSKDDIISLVGVSLGPNRLRCALLSLQILQHGLADYQSKKHNKSE